jgi:hypothetical protein
MSSTKQMSSKAGSVCCFMPVSCSAYSPILKIEKIYSSEKSSDFHRTTRLYIPDDRTVRYRKTPFFSHTIHNKA